MENVLFSNVSYTTNHIKELFTQKQISLNTKITANIPQKDFPVLDMFYHKHIWNLLSINK